MVPRAWEKFDASGELADEGLKERLAKVLVALVEWTWKMQG